MASYISELIFRNGIEIARLAGSFNSLVSLYEKEEPQEIALNNIKEKLQHSTKSFYKDYYMPLDKEMLAKLSSMYKENIPAQLRPDIYENIEKRYKGVYNVKWMAEIEWEEVR